ncbi:Uncharacterized protein Fot_09847 [Forsythia ovata]|uniref:Uncharacterized protein n=1 Tax=Forsythia ovata TaxID=205694 RepID=A0ABD1WFF2_9LAMI
MQIKFQRSIKQEAAAALSHSDQKETNDSKNKGLSKGGCSISSEMHVDSLLYKYLKGVKFPQNYYHSDLYRTMSPFEHGEFKFWTTDESLLEHVLQAALARE